MPQPRAQPNEPTQKTPKGLTIPIPTREEYLRNLEKVAPKPEPPEVDEKCKES
jgi:hypothetical protein